MSDPTRAAARSSASPAAAPLRRRAPLQLRPDLADQLEALTPRFDRLTQRARLEPRTHHVLHELEEEAQAIARDLVAPFRGPSARPCHPPRYVSADGRKAAW